MGSISDIGLTPLLLKPHGLLVHHLVAGEVAARPLRTHLLSAYRPFSG